MLSPHPQVIRATPLWGSSPPEVGTPSRQVASPCSAGLPPLLRFHPLHPSVVPPARPHRSRLQAYLARALHLPAAGGPASAGCPTRRRCVWALLFRHHTCTPQTGGANRFSLSRGPCAPVSVFCHPDRRVAVFAARSGGILATLDPHLPSLGPMQNSRSRPEPPLSNLFNVL